MSIFSTLHDYVNYYNSLAWVVVPVKEKDKQPIPQGWQKRTLADVNIATEFPEGRNVGILLGDSSGGLVDIDIDCPEALKIADRYLPETGMRFGRASNPGSHRIYNVEVCGDSRKYVFEGTLIEYRANGEQTVFPPSVHPSGEQYTFDSKGEPAYILKSDLEKAVRKIATACLLARCWNKGQRHHTALALAGTLLRADWGQDEVRHFIASVCIAAGDEEMDDRLRGVTTTAESLGAGGQATGLPTLSELIGDAACKRLTSWLGIDTAQPLAQPNTITSLPDEQFTDSRLSDVFAREYQGIARFCHETGCWFVWDGKHWAPDICEKIIVLVEECVRQQISTFVKTARASEFRGTIGCLSNGRFGSVANLARTKMPIKKAEFNADPWLFNCLNGVLDLRTGKLHPHAPELYQSFKANVKFDPLEQCPTFEKFIEEIMLGKPALKEYLQRAAGYTLTGATSEQCFFLLMGEGRNGKSTLLEVMRYIFGDYARTVAAKTLMISNNDQIPSDIALLEGKRYAPCSETSQMQRLNEARIKTLTGGDQVEARRRYADEYNYTPQFKLWVATNSEPTITGTDEAIWRRIQKIPFDLRLEPSQVDKELLEKLKKEASGILNWLLAGCLQWQKMRDLAPPDEVKKATNAYRAEMDVVQDFVSDCLRKSTGMSIANPLMYQHFKDWYNANVGGRVLPTHKEMTQGLKRVGFQCKGGKTRRWVDVALIDDMPYGDISDADLEREFSSRNTFGLVPGLVEGMSDEELDKSPF